MLYNILTKFLDFYKHVISCILEKLPETILYTHDPKNKKLSTTYPFVSLYSNTFKGVVNACCSPPIFSEASSE